MLARLTRALVTASYLRPRQALFFFLRRTFGYSRVHAADRVACRALAQSPVFPPQSPAPVTPFGFEFLNQPMQFAGGAVDWCPADASRLWRYHLHYFDYLHQGERSPGEKAELIDDWIARNPQGTEPGWEPYTASLRIANWVRYFMQAPPGQVKEAWRQSLFVQCRWLRANLEYHILANHYFENLRALMFGGAYFAGAEAGRWLRFAGPRLLAQLREQTLADGGHYERSPQYHCRMLLNYLDLYALAGSGAPRFDPPLVEALRGAAQAGLDFLADILLPDGQYPLFNDSAYGQSPQPAELFGYAGQLGFVCPVGVGYRVIARPQSGIFGYRAGRDGLLITCGDIGPTYQPGHAHCDLLSYELMLDGRRLVVDAGVCEYAPGALRRYARATASHNTCTVDDDEQSEVWGEFRIARRADKQQASIVEGDGQLAFQGAYRGFHAVRGLATHRRRVEISPFALSGRPRRIAVHDSFEGAGEHRVKSFVHFHPDVELVDQGDGRILLSAGGQLLATLFIGEGSHYSVEPGLYFPEFGLKMTNRVLVIARAGRFPLSLSYRFETA